MNPEEDRIELQVEEEEEEDGPQEHPAARILQVVEHLQHPQPQLQVHLPEESDDTTTRNNSSVQFQQPDDDDDVDDDTSMVLTEEERQWALEIKAAVRAHPDLDDLFWDMEYAQYALVVPRGHLAEALGRIYGMQCFRREYQIDDTVSQAMTAFGRHFQQQPGYLLHMDLNTRTQEAMIVLDWAAFYPGRMLRHDPGRGVHGGSNWNLEATKMYYEHFVCTPSLSAIRQGLFAIIDCDSIGWDNFANEYSQRLHSELWGHFPQRFKNILCYNTGSVANVCFSLVRNLLNANIRDSLQLGCQLLEMDGAPTPQRLSELYLQPTMEAAQQKLLKRIQELVQLKLNNQKKFRL